MKKSTTSAGDPEAFAKLQAFVRDLDIAMVTTVTPDGALHSRPMMTRDFTDDGEIWFFTADNSEKVADIAAEHAVNLSYADQKKQHYVSVTGSASIVHDSAKAKALWDSRVKTWFPRGLEDPHLALLRVRVVVAEYWDSPTSRMVRLFGSTDTPRAQGAHSDQGTPGEDVKVAVRAAPSSG